MGLIIYIFDSLSDFPLFVGQKPEQLKLRLNPLLSGRDIC